MEEYRKQYPKAKILREKKAIFPEYTFGRSKGLTFDRVLIYPTKPMIEWIKNNTARLQPEARAKFYVALTRARHSVAIVYDYKNTDNFKDIEKWNA